jgi:hypothetical protein
MPDARGLTLPAFSIVRDEAAYRTEEETMYPYISRALAQERARELQAEATRAHQARQLRLIRRARHGQNVRVDIPDNYEDFLCRTAEVAMREPTAVGRASGQAIR